jgi:ferredoxin
MGQVGLEMLLAALAYGAGRVVVACGPQDPPNIRQAVEWQTRMAAAILRGLGIPEENCRFAAVLPENGDPPKAVFNTTGLDAVSGNYPLLPPPAFPPGQDGRTLVRMATQYLSDQSGAQRPWLPLPAGSSFGAVTVDAGACTLCMACAAACPSGALLAGGDMPRLEFLEFRCHQCGLCEETCPESAIRLLPRLLCDPRAGEMPAVLCEVEPFRCVECGAPFATRAMVDRMRDKLVGHWMYADERQLRRLQMCGTCRTRDALSSQDMKSWNRS